MTRFGILILGLWIAAPSAGFAQEADLLGDGIATLSELSGASGLGGQGVGRNATTLFLALTILSLAPAIAITITCFPFIVTVLSIMRQSIGLQQSPPNMLIVSLSLFLTWFVMDPVMRDAWQSAGAPFQAGELALSEAINRGIEPFRQFMMMRVDPEIVDQLRELAPRDPQPEQLSVLVPSFMLSEIQRAFEIGFLVALPFLIIDLVVAAVLMAMGMMMVPPAVVSLPFKLAFFVAVDGWSLISGALIRSYGA